MSFAWTEKLLTTFSCQTLGVLVQNEELKDQTYIKWSQIMEGFKNKTELNLGLNN